jgi:hypothetical protein
MIRLADKIHHRRAPSNWPDTNRDRSLGSGFKIRLDLTPCLARRYFFFCLFQNIFTSPKMGDLYLPIASRHQEKVSRRIVHWWLGSSTSHRYCSCGTRSMFRWDPRGFMRYSCGTHTFWFVGPTILLWDSWLKIYVFSFCKWKRA